MIALVGAGPMAEAHARALVALGEEVVVSSRTHARAEALAARTGARASREPPGAESAIVAVGVESLAEVTAALVDRGCRRILVEKPGALTSTALAALARHAAAAGAEIRVAYNRRFYAAVEAARAAIAEDGGLLAVAFDFSEPEDYVLAHAREKGYAPEVLARWGVANSSHVLDL